MATKKWTQKNIIWSVLITILGIICFPVNPLVLSGVLETGYNQVLYIVGWFTWAFGMALVMCPIIIFPRWGGIKKGNSFVKTTRLVDTGIYSVVRHPQYLGGIFAIFITTLLWYPHWLFVMLGVIGSAVIYMGCKEEDKRLIQQFGEDYIRYMKKVPGLDLLAGIMRQLQSRKR